MTLHRIGAREPLSGSGSTADRLVVLTAVIAEAQIVHRSLACRQGSHSGEQGIGDRLGGFHIAGHHRRRRQGVQQTARRHDQLQRLEATGVQRNRLLHQATEGVEHHRLGDRQRGIEVAGLLR